MAHISAAFTPLLSALGGALIGTSSSVKMATNGKILGISGILGGAVFTHKADSAWQVTFLGGLFAAASVAYLAFPEMFGEAYGLTIGGSIVAGLLVGFGTSMGSGCTSGHGVCGLARTSRRSLVAVSSFMAFGFATASIIEAIPALRDAVHGGVGETPLSHYQIPYFGYAAIAIAVLLTIEGVILRPPRMPMPSIDPSGPPTSAPAVPKDAPVDAGDVIVLEGGPDEAKETRPADPTSGDISRAESSIARMPSRASIAASWVALIVSWFVGAAFAAGLVISGMSNPLKVVSFLTPAISTGWDPSLALVMGGALVVNFIAFPLIFRHAGPLLGEGPWSLPGTTAIDWNLVGGAALFGTGWGTGGFCPGPALVNVATGKAHALVLMASLLIGMAAYRVWTGKLKLFAGEKKNEFEIPLKGSGAIPATAAAR